MYTMPQMAILPAAVRDNEQRNMIITLGAGCCATCIYDRKHIYIEHYRIPFESLGFSNGYVPLMAICGVLAFISFWDCSSHPKRREKYLQPAEKRKRLKSNCNHFEIQRVYPNLVAWIMASMGYGMMFSTSVYYMMYYYERPDLISVYMGVISIGAMVSMMVLMPIVLKIFKTGQKALIVSQVVSCACYVLLFFTGKMNFTYCCVITFISTCFAAMQNALVNVLVNDTIDFIQLKKESLQTV